MALQFPNRMRSVNPAAESIAFSGYDGMSEIRFSMPFLALDNLNGAKLASTTAYLELFDVMRARIQDVAARTHARARKTFHILEPAKF